MNVSKKPRMLLTGALIVLVLLNMMGCAAQPAQSAITTTLAYDHTQVLFDPTAGSPLTLEQVIEVVREIVKLLLAGPPGQVIEFWTLDGTSARIIYGLEVTAPANQSRRTVERHHERLITTAVTAVSAVMAGILQDRPTSTPLLAGILKTVRWRMPGTTSLVLVVGSDWMECSDSLNFEATVPSEPAFLEWGAKRGLTQGTLTGLTVLAVYSDTARLDEQHPGRAGKIERLWASLLKGSGANDFTVIAGPFSARRFVRPRTRGRRKKLLLFRRRRSNRNPHQHDEESLYNRVINKDTISPPVAGTTEDDYVDGELGTKPREYDPTSHPKDAQAAEDSTLGPRIERQEGVVAEVQKRRDKYPPLIAYWIGMILAFAGEYVLTLALLIRLAIERLYAAGLAAALALGLVALIKYLKAAKRRLVVFFLCLAMVAALGSLAVLRLEDVADSEDTSPLANAAFVVVLILAAGGLPAFIEYLASRYDEAAEADRELTTETEHLDDLVDRKEAAIEYEARMRDNLNRYYAMREHLVHLARSQYPNAFRVPPKAAVDQDEIACNTDVPGPATPSTGDDDATPRTGSAPATDPEADDAR